ncbi:MAG TPA: GNAT family N-acetyltransferase [Dehalococcoidia bacterium]|nr:GNAT family N-acetyltransferase [Dehalococcoidia bacterium]
MENLTIRRATESDIERIAEIMAGEPGREAEAIAGSAAGARRLWMEMVRMPGSPMGWEATTVADADGKVVGVLQAGEHESSAKITPGLAILAIRIAGPLGIFGLVRRLRVQDRVKPAPIPGAYKVRELHVDPAFRSRGIGGALLDYAEAAARAGGYTQMTLTTTTENPARHLYERHGYEVVETKTDPVYQRHTGIEGRHRMVKQLR